MNRQPHGIDELDLYLIFDKPLMMLALSQAELGPMPPFLRLERPRVVPAKEPAVPAAVKVVARKEPMGRNETRKRYRRTLGGHRKHLEESRRRYHEKTKTDPERMEKRRVYNQSYGKTWRARLEADPVKTAARREYQRLYYHRRKERE